MSDYIWARDGVILGAERVAGTDADEVEGLPSRAIQRYLDQGLISLKPPEIDPEVLDAKQDASTAATDAELAAATADLATSAAVEAEEDARIAADALKQDASTAATDAELASGLSTKQDAATAATDAELAAALAALNLGTAATYDVGTDEGEIPLVGAGGVLPIEKVAQGTPSGKKFVRDDSTLAEVSGVIHAGSSTPPAETGIEGDYYHSTDLERLYGPKGSNDAWALASTPTLRGATDNAGNSSPQAISIPAGTQVGDLLILTSKDYAETSAHPAGWTLLANYNNGNHQARSSYKVATQADIDAGAVTVSHSGGNNYLSATLLAYANADSVTPLQDSDSGSGSNSSTLPAMTATSDAVQVVVVASAGGAATAPAGFTERIAASPAAVGSLIAYDRAVTAGELAAIALSNDTTNGGGISGFGYVLNPYVSLTYVDLSDREVTQAELDAAVAALEAADAALDTRVDALEAAPGVTGNPVYVEDAAPTGYTYTLRGTLTTEKPAGNSWLLVSSTAGLAVGDVVIFARGTAREQTRTLTNVDYVSPPDIVVSQALTIDLLNGDTVEERGGIAPTFTDGDVVIDRVGRNLYGPMAAGAWGDPTPLDEVTQAELDALDTRVDALEGASGSTIDSGVYKGIHGGDEVVVDDTFADDLVPADYVNTGGSLAVVTMAASPQGSTKALRLTGGAGNTTIYFERTVTLDTAGSIEFSVHQETEANYDYHSFSIDGAQQYSQSGFPGWQSKGPYALTAGEHTLRWSHSHDQSGTGNGYDGFSITDVLVGQAMVLDQGDLVRDSAGNLWQAKVASPIGAPVEGSDWSLVALAAEVTQAELDALDGRVVTLENAGPGATALAALTDVDLTGVLDGQALVYDEASETWVPASVSGGGSTEGVVYGTPEATYIGGTTGGSIAWNQLVNIPAGQEGDLLLLCARSGTASNIADSAAQSGLNNNGWTIIGNTGTAIFAYKRHNGASEAVSVTIQQNATATMSMTCVAYRGASKASLLQSNVGVSSIVGPSGLDRKIVYYSYRTTGALPGADAATTTRTTHISNSAIGLRLTDEPPVDGDLEARAFSDAAMVYVLAIEGAAMTEGTSDAAVQESFASDGTTNTPFTAAPHDVVVVGLASGTITEPTGAEIASYASGYLKVLRRFPKTAPSMNASGGACRATAVRLRGVNPTPVAEGSTASGGNNSYTIPTGNGGDKLIVAWVEAGAGVWNGTSPTFTYAGPAGAPNNKLWVWLDQSGNTNINLTAGGAEIVRFLVLEEEPANVWGIGEDVGQAQGPVAANTDTVVTTLPACTAGDLLVLALATREADQSAGIDAPAGWTKIVQQAYATAANGCAAVFTKIADGSEGGGTVTVTLPVSAVVSTTRALAIRRPKAARLAYANASGTIDNVPAHAVPDDVLNDLVIAVTGVNSTFGLPPGMMLVGKHTAGYGSDYAQLAVWQEPANQANISQRDLPQPITATTGCLLRLELHST